MPNTTWTPIPGYDQTDFTESLTFEFVHSTKMIEPLREQTIVTGEKNSQFIKFKTRRYFDGIDLVGKEIQVIFLSAGDFSDINSAVNAEYNDEWVQFGWIVPEGACTDVGKLCFSIEFVDDDYVMKSQKYEIDVKEGLNGAEVVPEPVEQAWYVTLQERCARTLSLAEEAEQSLEAIVAAKDAVENEIEAFGGSPLTASTAAGMTDTTRVYVYTGSETGYTAGNWYYYNGSSWASGGVYNAVAVQTDTTLSVSGKAADAKKVGDELADVKGDLSEKSLNIPANGTIHAYEIEEGYYSNNDGQKYPNTASTSYNRSVHLLRADELTLYYADVPCLAACFDKDGAFVGHIWIDGKTTKSKRPVTPAGTVWVGLYAQNVTNFTIHKVDSVNVQSAEYPYVGEYLHLEQCWANGGGGVSETTNLDLLIFANVKAGDKYYVSNNAAYNCVCFDVNGTMLTVPVESRNVLGKIYTIPENAVTAYFNLYRNRTKGTNSEMADYVAKITKGKVLAIGDSITWLDGRQNYGGAEYMSGWQRQLRLAGYDVVNAGWSGYPYATGLDVVDGVDYSIYKQIVTNNYNVAGYDYVILFGGTNDVLYNGALGDRPADYSNRTFDASKFNGAVGAIINYIRTNNSTAKILIASFPKSEAVSRTYVNASARVAELTYNADFWSCKYIDIFKELNVQPTYDQFDLFFYDATHPNYDGMQRIGKLMLSAVEGY